MKRRVWFPIFLFFFSFLTVNLNAPQAEAQYQTLWTEQFGTSTWDPGQALAVDGSGNTYVAGMTGGVIEPGGTSAGNNDIFLAKFDASGNQVWIKQIGTSGSDQAFAVAVDSTGNRIYLAGSTDGGLDGNTNAGGDDLFLVQYDASGVKQWTRQMGTSATDHALAVAVDSAGSAYAAGFTGDGLDGNTPQGNYDLFLVKYDASGVKQWTRQMGSSNADIAYAVAVDSAHNYVYLAGCTSGGLPGYTNAGSFDAFLVQYDTGGNWQWTEQIGTSASDVAYGVAVDSATHMAYMGGYTSGTLAGTSAGGDDFFLAKYDESGNQLWLRQRGSSGDEQVHSAAVDGAGNPYIAGWTDGGLDGNVNAGSNDVFLVKYDASGNWQWTEQIGSSSFDGTEAYVAVDSAANAYLAGSTMGGLNGNSNAGSYDVFLMKLGPAQVYRYWTKELGTTGHEVAEDIATDSSGNAYVTGWTDGNLDGNINAGSYDLFLTKYDTNGNKLWTRLRGTSTDDRSYSVALDQANNALYLAGYTMGNLDGGVNSGGVQEIILLKYDLNGNWQWTRESGTPGVDVAYGVAVDGSGNIYVTGTTSGDLDGNLSAGGQDLFLTKYASNGTRLWTEQLGTASIEYALSVAVNSAGDAYLTGSTWGSLGGTSAGDADLFLAKYDTNGSLQWAEQLGTGTADYPFDVAIDTSGNAYVTGETWGGMDGNTNSGIGDLFLVKYDTNGNKQWTEQMGSVLDDIGYGVTVDTSGNPLVAGTTRDALGGNTSAGMNDIVLLKYDSSGNYLWTLQMGTADRDEAWSIARHGNNLYLAGITEGALYGNTYAGDYDLFVMKLGPVGSASVSTGSNVNVLPSPRVDLTFQSVTTAGVVTTMPSSPTLPSNFSIVSGGSYNITFTGTFTGTVTVCITYNQAYLTGPESALQLLHDIGGGNWIDITTSLDTTLNIICGDTTSFSEFAVAEQTDYTISASAGANGSISPSGSISVAQGEDQSFTFTPNSGYGVWRRTVDGVEGISSSYTFNNVQADHAISVTFGPKITASAGANGHITPTGTSTVAPGGSKSYAITPDTGYHVANVLVDSVSVGAASSYTFTNVTTPRTISATFAQNTASTITASAGANGSISPSGGVSVAYNGSQRFTITPNANYQAADVLVDGNSVGRVTSYTFTNVTAPHTISASFELLPYRITASAGANGTITPSGTVYVAQGANKSFTFTPNTGYGVWRRTVDGVEGSSSSYTFNNVQADHTISVTFGPKITASAGANGKITPSGTSTVAPGGSKTYGITPNTGYHVANVLVDGSSVGAVTSYKFTNVTTPRTISVTFAPNP